VYSGSDLPTFMGGYYSTNLSRPEKSKSQIQIRFIVFVVHFVNFIASINR
jgi:hypothetical protein